MNAFGVSCRRRYFLTIRSNRRDEDDDDYFNIMCLFLIFRDDFSYLVVFVRALEHKRTVTSISLAEERQILKEINGIKKAKIQAEDFNKMEEEIQVMKVRSALFSTV